MMAMATRGAEAVDVFEEGVVLNFFIRPTIP
jgi:hypothetical protein